MWISPINLNFHAIDIAVIQNSSLCKQSYTTRYATGLKRGQTNFVSFFDTFVP